eukprot:TRINITY_DN26838_c0_g1_i1.p1 TRINITY_DN26838_c0_g1~~TRINITY_DN26838_c0_g1_i1.p1  ORF type:complete len:649 (+),score=157.19 TRINITY_DN26838_c0_g1_i1:64-2010(+)
MDANFTSAAVASRPANSSPAALWQPPCFGSFWMYLKGSGGTKNNNISGVPDTTNTRETPLPQDEGVRRPGHKRRTANGAETATTDLKVEMRKLRAERDATVAKTIEVESEIARLEKEVGVEKSEVSACLPKVDDTVQKILNKDTTEHLMQSDAIPFHKKKLLERIKKLQDAHATGSPHLSTIYQALSASLTVPDQAIVDSREEITSEADSLIVLLEKTLWIQTEHLTSATDEPQPCTSLTDMQLQEAKFRSQLHMLSSSLQTITKMQTEIAQHTSSSAEETKNALSGLHNELSMAKDNVKDRKARHETRYKTEMDSLEKEIDDLGTRKTVLESDIEAHRKEIEGKYNTLRELTQLITTKQKILSVRKNLEDDIAVEVNHAQGIIAKRLSECNSGMTIAVAILNMTEPVTTLCNEVLSKHLQAIETTHSETQNRLLDRLKAHWEHLLSSRATLTNDIRIAQREVLKETSSVRVQKRQQTEAVILNLQERLLAERTDVLSRKRRELEKLEEELEEIGRQIESIQSSIHPRIKAEFTAKYKAEKATTPVTDKAYEIHDSLTLICHSKAADPVPIEALLEVLDGLTYGGGLKALQDHLATMPATLSSIRLSASMIPELLPTLSQETFSDNGRSIPALLTAVSAKTATLLNGC